MENVIDCLEERGLIESATSQDLSEILKKPAKVYLGFDPTADTLHLGNFVGIMVLSWFKRCGHTPVALVGGATGLIGDPSGKAHERDLQTPEMVRHNLAGIRRDLEAILGDVWMVNNYDWFEKIGFVEFLRDVGKLFRLGPMLGKEMVRTRLESDEGMSFTEFSYQLIQAYDFLHLFDECGVTVQLGGSDQWGNITSGTELVRKKRGKSVHGLTFPLLTTSKGKKLGKTEKGAVWLWGKKCPPFDMYQYLFRTPDEDVTRFMRMLTFMEMSEVNEWKRRMEGPDYVPNSAQKRLAEAVVKIVHGDVQIQEPEVSMLWSEVEGTLLDLMLATELIQSKGEGRRLIRNDGVSLNNQKVADEAYMLTRDDLVDDQLLRLAIGKKKKLVIRIVSS